MSHGAEPHTKRKRPIAQVHDESEAPRLPGTSARKSRIVTTTCDGDGDELSYQGPPDRLGENLPDSRNLLPIIG